MIKNFFVFCFEGKYNLNDLTGVSMKKYHEHGPIVRDDLLSRRSVWLFDPDDIALVYRSESRQPIRGGLDSFRLFRNIRKDVYGDGGLLTTSQSNWHRIRSKAQSYLMKKNHFKQYFNGINLIAQRMTDSIAKFNYENENEDFLTMTYKWALDSVGMIMFNLNFNCINSESEDNQLIHLVSDMLECGYKLDFELFPIWRLLNRPFGSNWAKYIRANDKFIEICMKHIENVEKSNQIHSPNDTCSSMGTTSPSVTSSGCPFSRTKVSDTTNRTSESTTLNNNEIETRLDEPYKNCFVSKLLSSGEFSKNDVTSLILDLVMAGIDSTAHHLIFNLFNLAKNQNCQEELFEEINSLNDLSFESIDKMKFMNAVMKETHRTLPVVIGTNRVLEKDLIIKGFLIPKGTLVVLTTYVGCHLDKYFYKSNEFMPKRWLRNSNSDGQNDYESSKSNPFLMLPFGFGPRMCIGKRLAEFEVKMLIIKLIKRFRIEYDGDQINLKTKFINCPMKPLKFKFTPRN